LPIACRIMEPGGCSFSRSDAGGADIRENRPPFALCSARLAAVLRGPHCGLISSAPMPMCVIVGFASGMAGDLDKRRG
jgi:hypothetical protein